MQVILYIARDSKLGPKCFRSYCLADLSSTRDPKVGFLFQMVDLPTLSMGPSCSKEPRKEAHVLIAFNLQVQILTMDPKLGPLFLIVLNL